MKAVGGRCTTVGTQTEATTSFTFDELTVFHDALERLRACYGDITLLRTEMDAFVTYLESKCQRTGDATKAAAKQLEEKNHVVIENKRLVKLNGEMQKKADGLSKQLEQVIEKNNEMKGFILFQCCSM